MKKKYIIIIYVIILSGLLMGCGIGMNATISDLNSSQVDSQIADNNENSINKNDQLYYDVYEITDDNPLFSQIINKNIIDEHYHNEFFNIASTTSEFVSVNQKYIAIWKNEMADTISKFIKILSEEDIAKFLKNQKDWDHAAIENLKFEQELLTNDAYQVPSSTSLAYLILSEELELYRQRTIRIKYLHYLIEKSQEKYNAEYEYESLRFSSQ